MFGRKRKTSTGTRNLIGKSLEIRGDVIGSEDLLVDGRVMGSVLVSDQSVTIAGEVRGDVQARVVTILGQVHGNVIAEEVIEMRETATVEGDIKARRFKIEEHASVNGRIRTHADAGPALKIVNPAPTNAEAGPAPEPAGRPRFARAPAPTETPAAAPEAAGSGAPAGTGPSVGARAATRPAPVTPKSGSAPSARPFAGRTPPAKR